MTVKDVIEGVLPTMIIVCVVLLAAKISTHETTIKRLQSEIIECEAKTTMVEERAQ